jgi:hypothetical protein
LFLFFLNSQGSIGFLSDQSPLFLSLASSSALWYDNFLEYFNDIINCIKSKKYDRFFDSMMLDHKTLNKLKHNKIKI